MIFFKEKFVHLFAVPPHLNFHDVDRVYLSGMLEALPQNIFRDVDMELCEKLQYPEQLRYEKEFDLLPKLAVKLKLKNTLQFDKVQRHLGVLSRVAIDTKVDYNCAIQSVSLQLKTPRNLKNDAV